MRHGAPFDYVVLDEITELLAHFNSTTMQNKSHRLVPILQSIVTKAQHVISACADWGVSKRGAMFLKECKRDFLMIHAKTQADYRHYVAINPDPMTPAFAKKKGTYKREHMGAVLKQLLDTGKRVAVVSNTKSFIDDWAVPIAGTRPKAVFTSESSADPNEVKNAQMLTYSPTIGPVCLSTNLRLHGPVRACLQERSRMQIHDADDPVVRKLTTGVVFFCIEHSPQCRSWLSEHAIRQEQIALEDRIGKIGYFVNEQGFSERQIRSGQSSTVLQSRKHAKTQLSSTPLPVTHRGAEDFLAPCRGGANRARHRESAGHELGCCQH